MHVREPSVVQLFVRRFPSTRRNVRRARHLAVRQLAEWGLPGSGRLVSNAAVILGEFGANAVTHGHVCGRYFEFRLNLTEAVLHLEVSDARTGVNPPAPGSVPSAASASGAEAGRGLVLVEALADRWGVQARTPGAGKTVWAELDVGG